MAAQFTLHGTVLECKGSIQVLSFNLSRAENLGKILRIREVRSKRHDEAERLGLVRAKSVNTLVSFLAKMTGFRTMRRDMGEWDIEVKR